VVLQEQVFRVGELSQYQSDLHGLAFFWIEKAWGKCRVLSAAKQEKSWRHFQFPWLNSSGGAY
jgi:hypothetical protein